MNVYSALVALLLVLPTGGTARNMYVSLIIHDSVIWMVLMVAWTRGSDAGLSMDGGLQGSSYRRKEGPTTKLHGRLSMPYVFPFYYEFS
jgi:hypothetical protein